MQNQRRNKKKTKKLQKRFPRILTSQEKMLHEQNLYPIELHKNRKYLAKKVSLNHDLSSEKLLL